MRRLLACVALVACGGGGAGAPQPIVVPVQAGADAGAPSSERVEKRTAPPGSNGPADATSMIGAPGAIVTADVESLMLWNSAEIRKQRTAEAFGHALTSTLVGWDMFMPSDLVDPVKDIDWVLIAGSLMLGSTSENLFLAHYNVPEDRAEAVVKQLVARLPHAKRDGRGLTAEIDGATRVYLRPKPGVLAIVPPAEAKRVTDALGAIDLPVSVRPGELVRVVVNHHVRGLGSWLPPSMRRFRVWIPVLGDATMRIAAESDLPDEAEAATAAFDVRTQLASLRRQTFFRIAAGGLLDPENVWADGRTVRYDAPIDERLVELVGNAGQR
ncbi:MAG TPA: hypothetical protein VIF62_28475 [Labilithrix sp.]|jgi:hypothetical protein